MASTLVTLGMLTIGSNAQCLDFTSKNLYISLDEIVKGAEGSNSTSEPGLTGILGGAGTFAVVGARIVGGKSRARLIGWVVHTGHDFPCAAREELDSWNVNTNYIDTPDRATTRARNVYSGEHRGFEFVTPKMHVDHTMLDTNLLQAKVFHLIGTPERCITLVDGIHGHRSTMEQSDAGVISMQKPLFVWEPMENSCCPENLSQFQKAMRLVDVFSPNEDEFAKLIGYHFETPGILPLAILQKSCLEFIRECDLQAVVVRLGARGVYIAAKGQKDRVLPAFHSASPEHPVRKVIDVTGGGNSFLGAYSLVLADPSSFTRQVPTDFNLHETAALMGTVAASFVIEQVGMPKFRDDHQNENHERWNGDIVGRRVAELVDRL